MVTLSGKVAIVSGAGRGIGRSIAARLARAGASVVVNDLDEGPAEETVSAIRGAGGEAIICAGSVVDAAFAERFVGMALSTYGGLDIIINNAGYSWDSSIAKTTDEQWDAMLDVHLTAPFRVLRAAQPHLKRLFSEDEAAGRCVHRKVVNISSLTGTRGNAGQSGYAAGKAGIIGLTKTLSKEWGRFRVNVNAVAFGYILTRLTEHSVRDGATIKIGDREIGVGVGEGMRETVAMTVPLGRGGTPDEAAGAVYLFCLPESDYVSGEVLTCAGGL